jgi:hypothetical protein
VKLEKKVEKYLSVNVILIFIKTPAASSLQTTTKTQKPKKLKHLEFFGVKIYQCTDKLELFKYMREQ